MYKIIIFEGLPMVGKSTIINNIKDRLLPNVKVVDEIIYNNSDDITQNVFLKNDDLKLAKYNDGIIFIDRGPISTLSYNETKKLIIENDEYLYVLKHFNDNYLDFYSCENVYTIYLKNKSKQLRYMDDYDPYGSFENQTILENVTLKNIRKYCKNYEIMEYEYEDMESFINEIIDKYVCP